MHIPAGKESKGRLVGNISALDPEGKNTIHKSPKRKQGTVSCPL